MPDRAWKVTERAVAGALVGEGMAGVEAYLPALEIRLALALSDSDALIPGSPEEGLLCRNLEVLAPYVLWMMQNTRDCTGQLRVQFKNACVLDGPGSRPKRMID